MNILKLWADSRLQDETDGFEGGGGSESGEGSGEYSSPSFLRDISEDDAYDTLTSLPRQLSALESRFGEQLSPLQQQLEAMRSQLGAQTAVEPKFEKLAAVLEEFDPQLAKRFLPALMEDLKASISSRPLDSEALAPHLEPHFNQLSSRMEREMALGLLDAYGLNVEEIIPPTEGENWSPQTQTHKDFIKWYSMQDVNVQRALSVPGVAFARALRQFQSWSDGRKKEREDSAATSSARLSSGQQPNASRRQNSARGLSTEADGWASVFN